MQLPKWLVAVDNTIARAEAWYNERNMEPVPLTAEPAETAQFAPSRLPEFFKCIAAYEGANPANNNPTNERYYFGGYLPKYGVVKESSGGFAMFETLEIGIEYDTTCLSEMVTNHPEWDFLDFFSVFAPTKDKNDPVLYAKTISSEMGVVVTSNVKTTLNL